VSETMSLQAQLDHAEAEVHRLKRQIGGATCAEIGSCDWVMKGGRNAACKGWECACSVPVHICSRCGDCDYGENEEARETIAACRLLDAAAAPGTTAPDGEAHDGG
jgi:hypothetical protein